MVIMALQIYNGFAAPVNLIQSLENGGIFDDETFRVEREIVHSRFN